MRLLKSLLFIGLFQPFFIFCQTEGWVNSCLNITPKVVEAMIDACGNQEEFFREYVVFKTGISPYNIRNLAFKVTNPFNNAFVGSVKVDDLSTDPTIFQKLNAAVSSVCDYGISFRDALAAPYYGVVPQDAILLVFNNKNLDLDYLKDNILPTLCGSKVFVALGTLKAQSPGTAIFRNFPKNRSCGTTGCLRRIDFQYDGINAPFCEQMTYDIKSLPSPAVIRPNDEFGDGSYIRPSTDTSLQYGGGGPTGVNTICMPPEKLLCTVPPVPSEGNGFWNVLAFDDATFTNFRGYYQAKSGHTPSVSAPAGSFEYNTARDGWKPYEAPSEAHPTYGALTAYDGCNTKADTFSILAKRKGFPCGDYTLRLLKYDDHARIMIDSDGDGVWDFQKSYNAPACSNGCNTDIWTGFLGANSKMQIFGIDQNLDFQTHLLFIKKNTSPTSFSIKATTTPTPCGVPPVGAISLSVTGGNVATHSWTWTGPTPIPNNTATAINLAAGVYSVIVKDANGCQDSARFLVAQTNTITPIIAKKDTAFCAGGVASLRGSATGGTGALTYEWTTADGKFISNQPITNYTPYQNTDLIFKAIDANGCFKTDTMRITVNQLPYITIRSDIPDTICNNTRFTMKVNGANSFTWSANWSIATVNYIFTRKTPNEDSVEVNAFGLPAPFYIYTATGTDGNGCVNTAQKRFTLIPLPVVTIKPLSKTSFCNNDNPITVSGTPATGGKYYAVFAATNAPCVGCMVGQTFYPALSGPGQFNIVHELTDDKGCVNGPRVYLEVTSCVPNPCPPDVTNLSAKTCDPTKVGVVTQNLKKFNGCDSTVITTTTLFLPDAVLVNGSSCNPLDTGTFVKKLINQNGCDSVVTTKITLKSKSETRLTATTCAPSVVGEKTVVLKNINGCDSLVITTYTLINSASTNINSTSCNPSDTGTFVKNLKGFLGCDSIVTTRITLLAKSETRLTATTCDPSVVGDKTVTLKNQNGCDSLVITKYTLSNSASTNINSTSCNPLDTGTFVKNLKSYLGCDSVVTTKITLKSKSETRLTATTCDPSVVGEKTVTLKNQNGCDSLVITTYTLSNKVTTNLTSTSCNPLDTGTFVKNLKSYLGCDSVVTTKIKLSKLDTGRLNQTTCDPLKVGSEYITVRKKSGCDSVVLVVTTLAKIDTTFINLTSCSLANVGEKIQKYTRATGCDSIVATRTRYAPTNLSFSIKPSKSISCNQEDDGELTISGIKGGLPQYQILWSTGDTGSVLKNLKSGFYRAIVTDGNRCSSSDSFRLNEPIPLSIEAITNTPSCFYDDFGSIQLSNVFGGAAPYRFELGGVQKNVPNLPYTFSKMIVGRYPLSVFDKNNCRSDTVLIVQEGKRLIVDLGQDRQIRLGDSISLDVSANATIKNVKWQSETLMSCDTCLTLSVKPIATARYKVKITSTEGCQAEDMITVFIDKNKHVFVPNSFSPNGDKTNDFLMVYTDQSVEKVMTFQIFNRWGNRIFEKNNFQPNDETTGWDGFFNGQLVQSDVVVYFLEVMFKDGKTEILQGDITVMK